MLPTIIALALAGCSTYRPSAPFEIGIDYWQSELRGTVEAPVTGSTQQEFDVEDDLQLDPDAGIPVYRAVYFGGPLALELRYFDVSFDGGGILSQDIVFGGQVFSVNTEIESEMNLALGGMFLEFPLIGTAHLATGPALGVEYVDFKSKVKAIPPPIALTVEEDFEFPVPVAGWMLESCIPCGASVSLFLSGDVSGLFGSYRELDGTFLEFAGRGGVELWTCMRVGVGYRYFRADFGDDDGDDIDVNLRGLTLFAEVIF